MEVGHMANQDLLGKKFGRLTVISYDGNDKYQHRLWKCQCECGNYVTVSTARLNSGHTKSCGCISRANDLTGKQFGNLTVIKKIGKKNRSNIWLCRCKCGNEVECYQNNLERGTSTSCGCLRSYYAKQNRNCHGESRTILYKKWSSIKSRCYNPNAKGYENYGGRGIKMCGEWLKFWNFREWSYTNGYKDGLTIERKDVDGDYCPENCEWITSLEQQSNKRVNTFIEYGGKKQTAAQWARELGIGKDTITYRVRVGWTAEECLFGKEKNVSNCRPRMEIPDYLRNDDNEK